MAKDNKTEFVAFRLTPAERRKLASASASANMTESAFIRALLSGRIVRLVQVSIDGARLDALHLTLKRTGGLLNQLARMANRGQKAPSAELDVALLAHRKAASDLSDFIDETRPKCS